RAPPGWAAAPHRIRAADPGRRPGLPGAARRPRHRDDPLRGGITRRRVRRRHRERAVSAAIVRTEARVQARERIWVSTAAISWAMPALLLVTAPAPRVPSRPMCCCSRSPPSERSSPLALALAASPLVLAAAIRLGLSPLEAWLSGTHGVDLTGL